MRHFVRVSLAFLVAVVMGVAACRPGPNTAATVKPETDDQKALYALGLGIARQLEEQSFDLDAADLGALEQGLADGALKREPQVSLEEWGPKIHDLQKARAGRVAQKEKDEAAPFLADAAAKPGALRTESGLVYQEVKAGDGPSPKATDTVRVHYEGKLRDGTVFDSSVQRGRPVTFALSRVIPCWTEALQRMKAGGKSHVVCPSELAYGDEGAPGGRIRPGAPLAFDIELLEVLPPDAAGSPGLPPGHPPTGGAVPKAARPGA